MSKLTPPFWAFILFGQLALFIAVPAFVLGFGGAYADKHLQTSPLLMLLGFACAFCLSAFMVWMKVKQISRAF